MRSFTREDVDEATFDATCDETHWNPLSSHNTAIFNTAFWAVFWVCDGEVSFASARIMDAALRRPGALAESDAVTVIKEVFANSGGLDGP